MNSKNHLTLLCCLLFHSLIPAQNLIPNGDFEIPNCMTNRLWFEDMSFFIPLPYTMDTTDCITVRYVDTTHHLIASPQSGTRYTGSINLTGPRIQVGIARGRLSEPLEKDSLYILEYHFRLAPWSSYAFNLGIFCFTDSADGNRRVDEAGNIISSSRQCAVDTLREKAFTTDINRVYTNTDYWEKYSDCYQAKGGEEYYEFQMRIATAYNTRSYVWGDPAADIFKIMDQQDLPREAFHNRFGGHPIPAGVPLSNGTNFSIFADNMSLEKFSLRPYPEYTLEKCPHGDSTTTLTRQLIQDDPYLHFHHAQFLWEDSVQTLYRSFADTGVYQLQVTHKCFTLDYTFHVIHKECEEEEDIIIVDPEPTAIYIPNAFTPNGDGINDVFKPEGENFSVLSMQVFDRYGNLMYDQSGPDAAWDGRRKGQMLQSGIYIYVIQILNHLNEKELYSGELNLLR